MADMHTPGTPAPDPINEPKIVEKREAEIAYFRPQDAFSELSDGLQPGSEKYEKLKGTLAALPGFMRISFDALQEMAKRFDHVINITGFSGQGVHAGQKDLLEQAFGAIMQDKGWSQDRTLVISGGTALGIPHSAVPSLVGNFGYTAVGIMALPGVAYRISPGYAAICSEDSWRNWGDEMEPMAKVSTGTILAGGGTQALGDALKALKQNEDIAVIVNAFNGQVRVEYSSNGTRGDAILPEAAIAGEKSRCSTLESIGLAVKEQLKRGGASEEALQRTHLTSLPVSGLVTEIKNGERRGCGQDLLYFAITGVADLLPKDQRPASESEAEALRLRLISRMDLYYLLDDPHERSTASAVIKLNDAITSGNEGILNQVIDHAVEHDVWNPKSGHFGPPQLRARSRSDLGDILKRELRYRLEQCRDKAAA